MTGRAGRVTISQDRTSVGGYWWAVLANVIVAFVIGVIVGVVKPLGFVAYLYELAILVPGLAITVRCLRDAGKKWYLIFFALIPLVGEILLIIWLCGPTQSTEGQQV